MKNKEQIINNSIRYAAGAFGATFLTRTFLTTVIFVIVTFIVSYFVQLGLNNVSGKDKK